MIVFIKLKREEGISMAFKIGNVQSSGRILQWSGNSVAINKINSVDLTYQSRAFPKVTLWGIVIGLALLMWFSQPIIGIVLWILSGCYIYWWSQHIKYGYCVNLRTSSTEPFIISFGDDASTGNQVRNAILQEIAEI